MKHFIFYIFFCFCSIWAYADIDYRNNTKEKEQIETNLKTQLSTQTIPIQFHVIVENDGDEDLTESEIAEELANLNNLFDQVGFVFESCSPVNYISDSDYTFDIHPTLDVEPDGGVSNEELTVVSDHKVHNVINVFYVQAIEGADALGGITSLPGEERDWILVSTFTPNFDFPAFGEAFLAHQMGHYFNLYDTFRGEAQGATNEWVARENDGSNNPVNCGEPGVGDELCDTAADPEYIDFFSNGVLFPFSIRPCISKLDCTVKELSEKLISLGCEQMTDFSGNSYMPDHTNIMSNSLEECLVYFSPGQISRMRTSLLEDRLHLLSNSCDVCTKIKNLSGLHIGIKIFSVCEDIISTATVQGEDLPIGAIPANVVYNAGESVCLNPSFEAEYGSVFLAYIDGCSKPILPKFNYSIEGLLSGNTVIEPNPFNKQTSINYELLKDHTINISVSDVVGKKVATLVKNDQKKAGKHQVFFDGSRLSAGIYYCTIQAGNHIETQKMVITK